MLNDRRDLGSGREIQGFGSQASSVRRGLADRGQTPRGARRPTPSVAAWTPRHAFTLPARGNRRRAEETTGRDADRDGRGSLHDFPMAALVWSDATNDTFGLEFTHNLCYIGAGNPQLR